MKLLRQVSLYYQEGRSDKVYEVDLCEVGSGQFVVNFRYGRRGAALRDGTKTLAPVTQSEAERLFDELVRSKTEKGYRYASDTGAAAPPAASLEAAGATASAKPRVLDARSRAILHRIAQGNQPSSRFKLSRAIWRAGESRLLEAEPALLKLAGTGDAMLDYSIAWTLGRIGGGSSAGILRRLQGDAGRPFMVRRIAAAALLEVLDAEAKPAVIEQYINQLPPKLAALARVGPAEQFEEELLQHVESGDAKTAAALEVAYLIDNTHVRPAVLAIVQSAPLKPNYFQRLRHIFKVAELRGDGEVFGWLAYRFETERGNVNSKTWTFTHEYDPKTRRWKRKSENPLTGPNATTAYSHATRHYFRKRVWRTLRRLGELGRAEDYVRLATGVLLPFDDQDADRPVDGVMYVGSYSRRERVAIRYDPFHRYWAFNHILFGGSRRYRFEQHQKALACYRLQSSPADVPTEREEAFGHLWEQQPQALLHLLDDSRCQPVHQFAAKALRACREFCRRLDIDALVMLLRAPYEVTAELGFELAVSRYSATDPDRRLVLALANCNYQRGREQAHKWIDLQRSFFLSNLAFAAELLAGPHADTRAFARQLLKLATFSDADAQSLIARAIALLEPLGEGEGPHAADICHTLLEVFGPQLRRIGPEIIRDLFAHPLAEVQQFAGDLVLNHEVLSQHPPQDLLRAMLQSDCEAVRAIGVRIISQLSDDVLRRSIDLLVGLLRHKLPDVRENIRPAVLRLASSEASFGREIATRLVEALLVPGAPEGVPTHTARVLREDLRGHLAHIDSPTVWKLLNSRSEPAQEIGGILLATNVDASGLAIRQIVRLASHNIRTVREAAWQMCREQVARLKSEPAEAVRLLDAAWDDSRQFAFTLFREHFTADDLPAAVLVSICDSVREDVQQFGRELITRFFREADGPEYLQRLSEHPSVSMQQFTSNYLDRYASDGHERLAGLEYYFLSVLSRVNQGRIAKGRAFQLFEREVEKSPEHARIVARILARQSATAAIGDKGRTIELMVRIRELYPYIELPIEIVPVEVR